ncbi:COX15/CtaA family protein [Propionibacteriaceae bacterium Y1700]|uniref:COX15/CtaA family protein n=1 Tax=Microlunatus sp. Y1700 TaxID=3418487 RepID=UPI003DA70DED
MDLTRPLERLLSVRVWGLLALIANIGIIVTGAVVRLTGSGLGCPTWPRCTDASYLPHPELGIYGVIEFGNRLLTFVLSVVVIGLALAAFALRDERHPRGRLRRLALLLAIGIPVLAAGLIIMVASDYYPAAVIGVAVSYLIIVAASLWLTREAASGAGEVARHALLQRLGLLIALGIPGQAVVGGFTVLTALNPYVVAVHLIISFGLVALSTWFLLAARRTPRTPVTARGTLLARLTVISLALVLWLGTVVTGSGPHSGDEHARRTGLDPQVMSHMHAAAVYLTLALTVATIWVTRSRAAVLLLIIELAQGLIGFVQYFNGLPIAVVAAHLLGSGLVVAAGANLVWHTASSSLPGSPSQRRPDSRTDVDRAPLPN